MAIERTTNCDESCSSQFGISSHYRNQVIRDSKFGPFPDAVATQLAPKITQHTRFGFASDDRTPLFDAGACCVVGGGWEPERAPGNPRLARSRALTGHNAHKRDGTSTRVATFIIAAGKVTYPHYPRHREIKFLDLTNQTAAVEREHEIQVSLDSFS